LPRTTLLSKMRKLGISREVGGRDPERLAGEGSPVAFHALPEVLKQGVAV
jgi:hypothetical protein